MQTVTERVRQDIPNEVDIAILRYVARTVTPAKSLLYEHLDPYFGRRPATISMERLISRRFLSQNSKGPEKVALTQDGTKLLDLLNQPNPDIEKVRSMFKPKKK